LHARSMDSFETFPEQPEAKRLLRASLADGHTHAYLFHGPRGVGKRAAALAFAAEVIGEPDRVLRHAHPDVYELEPVGDQIRIGDVRTLHRDLHMRPFEAQRRVYILQSADTMNEDAADALLKDLEEPPPYAVIVLVADELGPLPETIRSRCQHVPFRRLSERAVREMIESRDPELAPSKVTALARVAGGRLDRVERLLDPASSSRRDALLELARDVYRDPAFEPADATARILEAAAECGAEARAAAETDLERLDLTQRDADQRLRRAQRGAEREELLASLEELAAWYRDLVVVATGAQSAAIHSDRLAELGEDATLERLAGAERACEVVRQVWRELEEFNLNPELALEALFVRLRRELGANLVYES
jgi:DNA polymerase-3 subunit delta'